MKVLVIEDEDILRISVGDDLKESGFQVSLCKNPIQGLTWIEEEVFDVALVDFKLPEMNGIQVLEKIKRQQPECEVIIMTAYGSIQTAVEAMKLGAYDFVTKPFSNEELILILQRIAEMHSLRKENIELKEQLREKHRFHNLISKNKTMQQIFNLLSLVADSNNTVLITGETGTGKEMVADAVHFMGARADKPFIKVSCALFSKDILESELFGHERGAFTGAVAEKNGRFALAHTGTLFLDDVDDIPVELQVKLLRVLQSSEFERVGGTATHKVDVRVVAASKANLLKKIKMGEFREDLYYRLNVIPINLPPLRDRKEDIPLLIEAFFKKYSTGRRMKITNKAMDFLLNYSWPGNVRELENLIRRLCLVVQSGDITPSYLPPEITLEETFSEKAGIEENCFEEIIRQTEIRLIQQALSITGGNKAKAAKLLKLKPSTLRSKIEKYAV